MVSEKTQIMILVVGIALVLSFFVVFSGWISVGPKTQGTTQHPSVPHAKTTPRVGTTVETSSETPDNGGAEIQNYDVNVDISCTANNTKADGEYSWGTVTGSVPLSALINPNDPLSSSGTVDGNSATIKNYKAEAYLPCTSKDENGDPLDCSCKWAYDGPASANILLNSSPNGGFNNWRMTLQFLEDDVERSLVEQQMQDCTTDFPDRQEFTPVRGPLLACGSGDVPFTFDFIRGSVIKGSDTVGTGDDAYQRDFEYRVNVSPNG